MTLFQIQSSVNSNYLVTTADLDPEYLDQPNHEANLGTALYVLLYLQQIISPLIFLYSEFITK